MKNIPTFNSSKIKCPICGKKDIELYNVTMVGNFYRCQSTGTELELKIETNVYFIEASNMTKHIASVARGKIK